MASFEKRKTATGETTWIASVRIRPFKAASRAFPSKEQALAWATPLERELKERRKKGGNSRGRADLTKITVSGLIKEYLEDPDTRSRSTEYVKISSLMLDWWIANYGAAKILDIDVGLLREARQRIMKGRAPATTNRYLSALRSAWNWGRSAGLVPMDLLWPSRLLLREPDGRTRYLNADELSRLLSAASEAGPLTNAAVIVSLATGIRQGELLRLRWADIDSAGNTLRVLLSKTRTPRSVYLPPSAVTALSVLKPADASADTLIFGMHKQSLMRRWHIVREAAALQNFRWHDLRHSTASFLAQKGANLLQIGVVLGHRSPAVTRRYAHLIEGAALPAHADLDAMLSFKP